MRAQVPKRIYTLEEMRLNKVEPTALLSPTDDTLNGVRTVLQACGAQRRHCCYAATARRLPHMHEHHARTHTSAAATHICCHPAGRCSSRRCRAVLWVGTRQRAAGRSACGRGVHLLCRSGAFAICCKHLAQYLMRSAWLRPGVVQVHVGSRASETQRCAVQIANGGGVQNLALDSAARVINREYSQRVALHEAGEPGSVALCAMLHDN